MTALPEKLDRTPLVNRALNTVLVAEGRIILCFGRHREIRLFRDFILTRPSDPGFLCTVSVAHPPGTLFSLLSGRLSHFGVADENGESNFTISFNGGCTITMPIEAGHRSAEVVVPGHTYRV